ncbi:DnaJ domain containing protein [Senna tora]|uniref:DnaJ domain containing protein n=1 Tax=Senna tora TaxID=362788 RepID=A0A834X233_9FABA|nr:DnaJ domain containing protein [Senna tora]
MENLILPGSGSKSVNLAVTLIDRRRLAQPRTLRPPPGNAPQSIDPGESLAVKTELSGNNNQEGTTAANFTSHHLETCSMEECETHSTSFTWLTTGNFKNNGIQAFIYGIKSGKSSDSCTYSMDAFNFASVCAHAAEKQLAYHVYGHMLAGHLLMKKASKHFWRSKAKSKKGRRSVTLLDIKLTDRANRQQSQLRSQPATEPNRASCGANKQQSHWRSQPATEPNEASCGANRQRSQTEPVAEPTGNGAKRGQLRSQPATEPNRASCGANRQRSQTKPDYYKVLEVDYDATEENIKLNYRRLALKWHPDKHKDDSAITAKFQEINEAYSVLSDPAKRFEYDSTGIYEIDKYSLQETFYYNTGISCQIQRDDTYLQWTGYRYHSNMMVGVSKSHSDF